jgi:hypothetical protein
MLLGKSLLTGITCYHASPADQSQHLGVRIGTKFATINNFAVFLLRLLLLLDTAQDNDELPTISLDRYHHGVRHSAPVSAAAT